MKRTPYAAAVLLLCALLLLSLAGCGAKPQAAPVTADALTGGEAAWAGERPVAVMVNNARNSVAQQGIAAASLVMEAYTSGDHTNLCLVYPSIDAVPAVGPVAAGSDLYWHFLQAMNILPVQRGSSIYARNYLHYAEVPCVDALEVGTNAFSYDGIYGLPDEFCWFTNGPRLAAVLPSMGIGTRLAPAMLSEFGEPSLGNIGAAIVQVTYTAGHTTSFGYDGETDTYFMYRPDMSPMRDAVTAAQTSFSNLLLLRTNSASLKDDGRTRDYENAEGTGLLSGTGWLITTGTCRPLTWQRSEEGAILLQLSSTDPEPQTLRLKPGRTYIGLLCPDNIPGQSILLQDAARNTTLDIHA